MDQEVLEMTHLQSIDKEESKQRLLKLIEHNFNDGINQLIENS